MLRQLSIENWRRLRALSSNERRTLLHVWVLLPATALGLRLFSFKRCQSALASRVGNETDNVYESLDEKIERARSIARMVRVAAARGLYRANCLPQALVLWWLLKRQGIESDLRIGVKRSAPAFEAHAWVEINGIALNEAADLHERFKPFDGAVLPAQLKFQ